VEVVWLFEQDSKSTLLVLNGCLLLTNTQQVVSPVRNGSLISIAVLEVSKPPVL